MTSASENKTGVDLKNMEFEEIIILKREIHRDIESNEKRFEEYYIKKKKLPH